LQAPQPQAAPPRQSAPQAHGAADGAATSWQPQLQLEPMQASQAQTFDDFGMGFSLAGVDVVSTGELSHAGAPPRLDAAAVVVERIG